MKERYIDIDSTWGIILCYDYRRSDIPRMRAVMESFGMTEYGIIKALNVLRRDNTGMAVSRSDLTMSVIFVSPADSIEQFYDTIAHEIDHVQSEICRHYGVDEDSEDAAWLQGYMMREIVRILLDDGFMCQGE